MLKQIATQKLVSGCKQVLKFGLFSFYVALSLSAGGSLAEPIARLENWRFYPEAQQLEVMLSGSSQPRYFYLPQPPRIVVDLPDTKLGYVPTQQRFYGNIQGIRVSQFDENVTRIVMDLAPGTFFDSSQMRLQPISRRNSLGWVFRPLIASNYNSIGRGQGRYPLPSPNTYYNRRQYPPLPYTRESQPRRSFPSGRRNRFPQQNQNVPLPPLNSLPGGPVNSRSYNNENYREQLPPINPPGAVNIPATNLPNDLPRLNPSLPQPGLQNLPPVNSQFGNNRNYNQQQLPIFVPSISPNNSFPQEFPNGYVLPPSRFQIQPARRNINNQPNVTVPNVMVPSVKIPSVTVPDFPTPTILNNSNNSNNSNNFNNSNTSNNPKVIEFGQPFPNTLP
ncbi:MAG: AMIN domain-containing protein [Mastigocoleus sp. MO_167.B18]|nr:AMIN domain-containing protein [Mastigocoleus sp. MO_167.B18]